MAVAERSSKLFVTEQDIVEVCVDRRLGFESDDPPEGWKWDRRFLNVATYSETLPNPGLKKTSLGAIPRSYWQNGPLQGSDGEDIKVTEIRRLFADGTEKWVPVLNTGSFIVWRDGEYLFSDDSVVERLDTTLTTEDYLTTLDSDSRTRHKLGRVYRTGSAIRATIFKRVSGENTIYKEYTARRCFSGLLDADGEELDTVDGDYIYWDNVDTTKNEFIAFQVDEDQMVLQFAKDVTESITTGSPTVLADFNDLELVGTSDGTENQSFQTTYFPIAQARVYVVDPASAPWVEWTVVTTFTGTANQVKVDYDLGTITFGTTASSDVPANGYDIYVDYKAVPRLEYEEEDMGDEVEAIEANVSPMGQSINKGFVVIARNDLDIYSIELETDKSRYLNYQTTYGPVYIGSDFASLKATVYSSGGEVIPNAEVTFTLAANSVGTVGGSGTSCNRKTSIDGTARTYYTPPVSAEEIGFTVKTLTSAKVITVPSYASFTNVDDVYTYWVLKDDPWLGKVGADTTIGEVEWDPTTAIGRRAIYCKYDPTNTRHPISGETGAYAPVRPASITSGNVLTYTDDLDTPDADDPTINLGAYWIVSDRFVTVTASVYSPRLGTTITSDPLTLRVELPSYMKGEYILDSLRIPFGWRTEDTRYDYASAVQGATFVTINPIAGPWHIINVVTLEPPTQWQEAYPYPLAYPLVEFPFGVISFTFVADWLPAS